MTNKLPTKFRFPFERVKWPSFIFLFGVLLVSLTLVPWYMWTFGLNAFEISLFFFYTISTGLSITLGYHRLLSHLSFKAKWPVKLYILLFGAAAFENSALDWVSDHRNHHKHVDHDDDPYDISKGFFFAHMGWMVFKLRPQPPFDNVPDLLKDKLVMWQHRYIFWIGAILGFVVPTLLGFWHGGYIGALGGLLIPGVLRTVFIQQGTFFINSACHTFGKQTYSSKCSARDSLLMAFFTFGEGYHNYHHEFQHDYRNGPKVLNWDPTKWTIWMLSKVGLTSDLRRVPDWKIFLAEMNEAHYQMEKKFKALNPQTIPAAHWSGIEALIKDLQEMSQKWIDRTKELQAMAQNKIDRMSKDMSKQIRKEINLVNRHLDKLNQFSRRLSIEESANDATTA
jgi:stearoyl-CoA desaturase (delta-9 desaturase)